MMLGALMVNKVRFVLKLLLTLVALVVLGFSYWLFVADDGSQLRADRLYEARGVSYKIRLKYYINGATIPNVAEFYSVLPEKEPRLILRLLTPNAAALKLDKNKVLICYNTDKVDYLYTPFLIDRYGLSQVDAVVVPFEEGVRCSEPMDAQIKFNNLFNDNGDTP